MLLLPGGLLLFWFTGLLSLGLLGGGIYLVWEWYEGNLVGREYLIAGILLVAFTFLGRPLVLLLVGRKNEADIPPAVRDGTSHRLMRPDGTELAVESYGPVDAPTIVLTHGWGMDSRAWRYAKQHLAGRFRLLVWDLPGLGKSSRPKNNDYELDKMARDLEAVVRLVPEQQPVVLLGYSIGGMITLTFCRLFPEQLGKRVAGLALVQTTYTNPARTAPLHKLFTLLQKPVLEPLCYLMIVLSPLARLMNWLNHANGIAHLGTRQTQFGGQETKEQLEFAAHFGLLASPSVIARGMLAMFRYDATAVLSTIPVPVLVITGDKDKQIAPGAGEHMGQTVPDARLVNLSGAGHMGLLEQHAPWAEAVGAFGAACLSTPQRQPV